VVSGVHIIKEKQTTWETRGFTQCPRLELQVLHDHAGVKEFDVGFGLDAVDTPSDWRTMWVVDHWTYYDKSGRSVSSKTGKRR